MRIATNMVYLQSLGNINKRHEAMFTANQQVTSGKRVNRPSDDPVDAGKILGIRSQLDSIKQYQRNIKTGTTWLRYTESVLGQAEQIISGAKTLAVQMSSDTYNADQRAIMAGQVEQMYDELILLANTKVVDRYIFSGHATNVQPFSRDTRFNADYHGDNNQIQLTIQQETRVTINTTGQKAFIGDTNVFDVLRDLRNALRDNDREVIQQSLPRLDGALSKLISERAYVGTSLKQMEAAESVLIDFGYTTEELLSKVEDTDMVEALTRLSMHRIAYEATLKSTALVTELSLVNFI